MRGELVFFCACMLVSFLLAGFWYPYWRIADMDFWVVYNAFLLNAHLPQEMFAHTSYLSILLLSWWLQALHALGIVKVIAFTALPPVKDAAAFAGAWTEATQAGRVLSLLFAMSFVLAFSYLLRALVRDWRVAAFGGFLLAFSGGMAMEMRIMRSELLAAGFFFVALLMLLVAASRGQRWWRPALIGVASLLMTLGMLNKVQLIFSIIAVPVLLLPFGPEESSQRGFWNDARRAWPTLATTAAVALLALYFAWDILVYGLTTTATATLQLPELRFGATRYWPAFAIWIGLGMAAYAVIWKVARLEALAAALAVLAGCMIGLLALDLRYHPNNVVVIFHPFEQLFFFASKSNPDLNAGGSFLNAGRLEMLFEWVAGVIARRTFVLASSPRPAIFLEWFVIAATVIAIRRRDWLLVVQVAVLMLADWGLDTLNMSRGLKQEYFLFADPFVIIAAALLITKLTDLRHHRWTYRLGIALIAVHFVLSQAEPVKHVFRTEGVEKLCGLYRRAQRVEHFPFCSTQLDAGPRARSKQ